MFARIWNRLSRDTKLGLIAIFLLGMASGPMFWVTDALASLEQEGGGGNITGTAISPASVSATGASATCEGDAVSFDSNGAAGCQHTTDVAPQGTMLRSQAAFPGGTQTASKVLICGGQDETIYTVVNYAVCGTDTMTVTVVDSNGTSTATALVEATDWTAATSNNVTATNLAAAINALAGVSAVASAAVVRISLDPGTCVVTTATSDTGCATRTEGTRGIVEAWSRVDAKAAAGTIGFGVLRGAFYDLDTATPATAVFYYHPSIDRIRFSKPLWADATVTDSITGDGDSRLQIISAKTDSATAVAVSVSSNVAFSTAGAKLFSVKNNDVEQAAFDKDGAVRLNVQGGGSQPTCVAGIRGTVWYTAAAAGVLDALEVCRKDAANNYAWAPLF